jgi:hypothetical protein
MVGKSFGHTPRVSLSEIMGIMPAAAVLPGPWLVDREADGHDPVKYVA